MNIFLLFTNGDLIEMCMDGRSLKMEVPDKHTHGWKERIIARGWPAIFFNKSRTKEKQMKNTLKIFRGKVKSLPVKKIIDL